MTARLGKRCRRSKKGHAAKTSSSLTWKLSTLTRRSSSSCWTFFNNDVFPVDKNQNISRTEVRSVRPALRRTIKRVRRRSNNLLAVDENMRQLIRFIDVGFDNPLQCHVSACLVPCPDEIPDIDLLNWNVAAFGNNRRPGYKANLRLLWDNICYPYTWQTTLAEISLHCG